MLAPAMFAQGPGSTEQTGAGLGLHPTAFSKQTARGRAGPGPARPDKVPPPPPQPRGFRSHPPHPQTVHSAQDQGPTPDSPCRGVM